MRAELLLALMARKLPPVEGAMEVLTDPRTDEGFVAFFENSLPHLEADIEESRSARDDESYQPGELVCTHIWNCKAECSAYRANN